MELTKRCGRQSHVIRAQGYEVISFKLSIHYLRLSLFHWVVLPSIYPYQKTTLVIFLDVSVAANSAKNLYNVKIQCKKQSIREKRFIAIFLGGKGTQWKPEDVFKKVYNITNMYDH